MAVSACSSLGFIECLHCRERYLFVFCHYHLGDAFAVFYHEVFLGEINEQYAQFPTVVSVNGAWRVEHGNAMLQGQAAAWSYLRFVPAGLIPRFALWRKRVEDGGLC